MISSPNEWILELPKPNFGRIAPGKYNAGPGLADDITDITPDDSYMQIIKSANCDDYDDYIHELLCHGYTQILANQICGNKYSEFSKDDKVWHISYFHENGEVRVVEDTCSAPINEFEYNTVGDQQTAVYQYGLYYDPQNRDNTGKTINCGMLYVIRLSDNSVIMIDGGHIYQCSDEAIEGLWTFLHEITGIPNGETVKISAWYFTHAHGDHVTGCVKLLNRYHDLIDLQRVMYNFPSYQVRSGGYDSCTTLMKSTIRKYYPCVDFLKLHSGQIFDLSNVKIEVLYTHEDAVNYDDFAVYTAKDEYVPFPLGDYNCSSSILRMYIDGKSFMFLGDTNVETERVVSRIIPNADVWKSDVVQIAHHCFNYLNILYAYIQAPVAMLPNSYYGGHTADNLPKLDTVLKYVQDDMIYYEGEGTDGFSVVDGKVVHVYNAPVVGKEYDNSGLN